MMDLFCLVADKNMKAGISGLLGRPQSLGIRSIQYQIQVHGLRDSGCFHSSAEILQLFKNRAKHAIVMLDQAWEGVPCDRAEQTETAIEGKLRRAGMSGWARPIVLDPELEAWVFSGSPHVDRVLGWSDRRPGLRDALEGRDLWRIGDAKPRDPKAALEWALAKAREKRTSTLYRRLAQRVGTASCRDRAFLRFKDLLQSWYPKSGGYG